MVLVSTIVGWNVLLDWATYRFVAVRRLVEPPSMPLVVHGKIHRRNLRRELIADEELMAKLREKGIENVADVKLACMESDGEISVLEEDPQSKQRQDKKPARPGVAH